MATLQPIAARRSWAAVRRMYFSAGTYNPALPTAAFDLDSTLIPFRGRGPPAAIGRSLLVALAPMFNLLVITNRGGCTPEHLAPIEGFIAELDADLAAAGLAARATACAATAHDRHRKPHTGAWEHFVAVVAGGVPPRFGFYCGDAAGRHGDHSACDYMFALNVRQCTAAPTRFEFIVPEAVFGAPGARAAPLWAPPENHGAAAHPPFGLTAFVVREPVPIRLPGGPCVVILCGSPASGKSRLAARIAAEGFVHLSNDLQGKAKSSRLYAEALAQGERVVIDNTHPGTADRATVARQAADSGHDHAIVVMHITTPKELCFHLNAARCQLDATGATPELPAVVLHTFWKRFEPPTEDEVRGYGSARMSSLVCVPFCLEIDAPAEVLSFRYC